MKYLVIGDANSMHIYNFAKNFLIPRGFEVHLLTLSTKPVRDSYKEFYKQHGVTLHSVAEKNYKGLERTDRVFRLINLFRKLRLMWDVPRVDICHLQSVYKTAVMMALYNKRKYKKLLLSYWGGDLEVCSQKILEFAAKGLDRADAITVTVKQVQNEFREIYGNKYDDKLHICRFATAGLDCIDKISKEETRAECRESYKVPKDKILITCGYSAYREQHQEQCIDIINTLPQELKEKIHCIIPMQYGRLSDTEYIEKVEKAAEKADFTCDILREYVPFEQSARLAVATDIYLHLRDTDAFSNALKEHVFAGSKIIKGDWLTYIELSEMNADVLSIDSFNSLADTLKEVLAEYQIPKEINLFSPIYDLYSTEKINAQWANVIEKL